MNKPDILCPSSLHQDQYICYRKPCGKFSMQHVGGKCTFTGTHRPRKKGSKTSQNLVWIGMKWCPELLLLLLHEGAGVAYLLPAAGAVAVARSHGVEKVDETARSVGPGRLNTQYCDKVILPGLYGVGHVFSCQRPSFIHRPSHHASMVALLPPWLAGGAPLVFVVILYRCCRNHLHFGIFSCSVCCLYVIICVTAVGGCCIGLW